MIGFYATTLIFVCENLDRWDFEDALKRSTTGKLKVEYIEYYNSTTFPYYLSIRNFEPWDDGLIIVPANYDYKWYPECFAMEELSDVCNHQYSSWISANSSKHAKICEKCGYDVLLSHEYGDAWTSISALKHSKTCIDCGYVSTTPHHFTWTSLDSYQHRGVCSFCRYIKTETHSASYDQATGRCQKCGYSGSIQLYSIYSDSIVLRE